MSKFILPPERIPKSFRQDIVDENGRLITSVGSCAACTLTKILEVLYYVKTGKYIELSKGYMYGRNNYPSKTSAGMSLDYTLKILLERGTVPVSMCNDYDEFPDIFKILESRKDIAILDEEAKNYTIDAYENIGKQNLFDNVKKYLEEKQLPLAVVISKWKGEKHAVVAVGYDGDNILWQDHDGTDKIKRLNKNRFEQAFYLEVDLMNNTLPFDDVTNDKWFYDYVLTSYREGIMVGKKENEFAPNDAITRAEMAAIISRLLVKIKEQK